MSEIRFSTRHSNKVSNYNEDDNLGLSDEDSEMLTPNYWVYAEDDALAIDVVLNHRLKDDASQYRPRYRPNDSVLTVALDIQDPDKNDFEFYVRLSLQRNILS